ncbi:SDR family NAD(P)-dependent oxidoreductase [Brevundimonas sp.]|uniref:SDR family NAD(P)-dependent oxidoreductase n=1 Tax=Brevundimonas sp. TaxID=1871086 RepID=UPI003BA9A034
MSQELKGRTALVTGASSGLGRHLARRLAAAGANVVAGARRLDQLEALAAEVRAEGGRIEPVRMDVEDEASIMAAFDAAEAAFGTVDVVLANAGLNAQGAAVDLDADALAQLLRVNVQGVYLTAREAARRLIASPEPSKGRIILVGSVGTLKPLVGLTAYSMSKAAVGMMGKGLAREWARWGVNVNTICPGWIETELNGEWLASEPGQKLVKSFPRRRVMQPADLDGLVLFLASDASESVTGGVFSVDEGQSL